MVKGLFRLVTKVFHLGKSSSPKTSSMSRQFKQQQSKNIQEEVSKDSINMPPHGERPIVTDLKTGEVLEAEIIDIDKQRSILPSDKTQERVSQNDIIKQYARNEAYVKAVKGLMAMNLDTDILTDAIEDLREKYYGTEDVPKDVVVIVENMPTSKTHPTRHQTV